MAFLVGVRVFFPMKTDLDWNRSCLQKRLLYDFSENFFYKKKLAALLPKLAT